MSMQNSGNLADTTSELMLITRSGVTSSHNWQIVVVGERCEENSLEETSQITPDWDCYLFNIYTGSPHRLEYNYVITSTHCDTLGRLSIWKNAGICFALTPPCQPGVRYNSPQKISSYGKYIYICFPDWAPPYDHIIYIVLYSITHYRQQ